MSLPVLLGTAAVSGTLNTTIGTINVTANQNLAQVNAHAVLEAANGQQVIALADSSGANKLMITAAADAQVQPMARSTGGFGKSTTASLTVKTQVKAVACTFGGVNISNTSGATAFVQVYDALSANVTPGTTVPDFEYQVANGAAANFPEISPGTAFATGLTIFSATAAGGGTPSGGGVRVEVKAQ